MNGGGVVAALAAVLAAPLGLTLTVATVWFLADFGRGTRPRSHRTEAGDGPATARP